MRSFAFDLTHVLLRAHVALWKYLHGKKEKRERIEEKRKKSTTRPGERTTGPPALVDGKKKGLWYVVHTHTLTHVYPPLVPLPG